MDIVLTIVEFIGASESTFSIDVVMENDLITPFDPLSVTRRYVVDRGSKRR
jgi:hypothetical protein